MTALAPVPAMSQTNSGLKRSAALMRALGARANAVWATLSPQEAERLTRAMDALPDDETAEHEAAQAFLSEEKKTGTAPQARAERQAWPPVSATEMSRLSRLVEVESPQVVALILSRLPSEHSAGLVRALPRPLATEALKRLLSLGVLHPSVPDLIDRKLRDMLTLVSVEGDQAGHERVARIFDNLAGQAEDRLLNDLDQMEPGAGRRIRALMFTFDDLATLGPASLQTLLTHVDRSLLTVALKGAKAETIAAFYSNMTRRAADLLKSEIDALQDVRRSDTDQARRDITSLARTLANRGDILTTAQTDEDLVE